ncbi:SWIM zinc finger family protein [Virgisporangium aliadipatigenens]|uniref:SWIM zinc finger family protein n=1 Tax=Virgisporangium aliadipatigenens TaxID=741659 RepID=UPI0019420883|nr:SWIM zinc finger family protein [Virgisporangium aliadipatigenens]
MTIQAYAYLAESSLAGRDLRLQTSSDGRFPRFFTGFLTTPEPAALGLLAVAEVARTRYYRPRDPAGLDPVVTGSADRLRFESFSGCCGVYARLDVLPAGLDGDVLGPGTTNVDVNDPLRRALTDVTGLEPLHLSVGPDDLTVSTMDGAVVERKVPLPDRWLRGFAEVPVIASAFDPRAELDIAEARAFLHRLPAGRDTSVLWAVPAGRALRLTSRPVPGAVCLAGAGRLAALRPLLRFASALRVYGPPVGAGNAPVASTWELDTGALRLSLTLSPEPRRGFSGEGAVLPSLADAEDEDAELIGSLLAWDPTVDVAVLAARADIPVERTRAALIRLGTAGQVGYDVSEAAYFHRVLPYDATRAARDNPRLVAARALVEAGAVEAGDGAVATVRSGERAYRVRRDGAAFTCTCEWWGRYRGGRGPCKHALAVSLAGAALAGTVAEDAPAFAPADQPPS